MTFVGGPHRRLAQAAGRTGGGLAAFVLGAAGTHLSVVPDLIIEDRGTHTYYVGSKPSQAQGTGLFSLLRPTFDG